MSRWSRWLRWSVRRRVWNALVLLKFSAAKPRTIPPPPTTRHVIAPKPMATAIRGIPVRNVMVCPAADIPAEERERKSTVFYRFQVWLYSTYSPMQPRLPSIDTDPRIALGNALTRGHRRRFRAPEMPAEYLGSPDLGSLAVRGPFACYTTHTGDDTWEWDLRLLDDYEHHPGLLKIGSRVVFGLDPLRRSLRARSIECALGSITPSHPAWDKAREMALCAASTHVSLVRHFNWVHLAGGASLALATRNSLSPDHPLFRLLWPHIFATLHSNDIVTRGQMSRGGDFETIFSLTFEGMCRLFDETHLQYPHRVNDPVADGDERGVRGAGFDTPTQDNLEALFAVMHAYTGNYVRLYYPGPADISGDTELLYWLEELNLRVPNGVGVGPDDVTSERLARLLASLLFMVTAQHEILGSFMWDYQLWTHRQPPRVYADFRREPLDVYQRLLNANFILNVHRRRLMDDFTAVALDDRARAVMEQFQRDLGALQAANDNGPRPVWRIDPRDLEVNINS